MVRTYRKKTNLKATSPEKLEAALKLVKDGYSYRQVAKLKGVNRQTLWKIYVNLKKSGGLENVDAIKLSYGRKSIFTSQQEDIIATYCMDLARMGFGLSVQKVRELAYEVAVANHIDYPKSWDKLKSASRDWFTSFMKRHGEISIRKPEGCSIARASAFNKPNVKNFYEKLEIVLKRHPTFARGA